jgi:hypothetical protein
LKETPDEQTLVPWSVEPAVARGKVTGVFIIGMHRSGTSVVTRAVNLLGVPLAPEARHPRGPSNPAGLWEAKSLTLVNEEILGALGGTWSAPPLLAPGWTADERLSELRKEAEAAFARAHPAGHWAWKDPRNSLLLPFWLELLDARPVAVAVLRNPLEVWRSLAARNGFSKTLALALWERYTRASLTHATGLPTFVVRYEELIGDPSPVLAVLRAFLADRSLPLKAGTSEAAASYVDPALQHQRCSASDFGSDGLSDPQRELFALAVRLSGPHERLPALALPEETPSTERTLADLRLASAELAVLRGKLKRTRERFMRTREKLRAVRAGTARARDEARSLRRRVAELERELTLARHETNRLGR